MATYYPITGIKAGAGPLEGQVPLRQEIDEWSDDPKNKIQVDMFLLGLQRFQDMSLNHPLSYYQVAGIHGFPLKSWDEKIGSSNPNSPSGYCTHNNILFATWHRPYLLLFEQRIYECMKEIIAEAQKESPDADFSAFINAADTWRLPFWDWARKKKLSPVSKADYTIPKLIQKKKIDVEGPLGKVTLNPNPLYCFEPKYATNPESKDVKRVAFGSPELAVGGDGIPTNLHPVVMKRYEGFRVSKRTNRWLPPYSPRNQKFWIESDENNDSITPQIAQSSFVLLAKSIGITEQVYRLFTTDRFDYFGTKQLWQEVEGDAERIPAQLNPLESIHDSIHYCCGGDNGFMSNVPIAAFDPIFWLHHCNVDRLIAMWQARFPESWFDKPEQQLAIPSGNWFLKQQEKGTPQIRLRPFHKDTEGNLYDSDDAREWISLGYSYPELQPWLPKYKDDSNADLYQADLAAKIEEFYGSGSRRLIAHQILEHPLPAGSPRSGGALRGMPRGGPRGRPRGGPRPGGSRGGPARGGPESGEEELEPLVINDYVVEVTYSRYDLEGTPYIIYLLLGDEEELQSKSSNDLLSDGNVVGAVFTFSSSFRTVEGGTSCSNCEQQAQEGILSVARVPLTQRLVEEYDNHRLPLGQNTDAPLRHKVIDAYLKEKLHWRVEKIGVEEPVVDFSEVPNLKVKVLAGLVQPYEENTELSWFGDHVPRQAPTADKPCGY